MPTIKLGTISARHDMPVDEYLLSDIQSHGQKAYAEAYHATRKWALEHPDVDVELYYTGLTEVTIATTDALDNMGMSYTLMRFDQSRRNYQPLYRSAAMKTDVNVVQLQQQLAQLPRFVDYQLRLTSNSISLYSDNADPEDPDNQYPWALVREFDSASDLLDWILEELRDVR